MKKNKILLLIFIPIIMALAIVPTFALTYEQSQEVTNDNTPIVMVRYAPLPVPGGSGSKLYTGALMQPYFDYPSVTIETTEGVYTMHSLGVEAVYNSTFDTLTFQLWDDWGIDMSQFVIDNNTGSLTLEGHNEIEDLYGGLIFDGIIDVLSFSIQYYWSDLSSGVLVDFPSFNWLASNAYGTFGFIPSFDTSKSYDIGYGNGFTQGKLEGKKEGMDISTSEAYQNGYDDALNRPEAMTAFALIKTVIEAPFYVVQHAMNFEIFGINVANLFFFILSFMVVGLVIKFIGGVLL